jgi:adenylate cyclase
VPIQRVERKLAAIFAADIEGHSRSMGRDEVGTLDRLRAHRIIVGGRASSFRVGIRVS